MLQCQSLLTCCGIPEADSVVVITCHKGKPPSARPTDRVFRTVPTLGTFKNDLARAGILFRDEHGRQIDRHALRTTFISWLGAAGVDPRVAQSLARHSHIELTTEVYQDKRMLLPNIRAAVCGLPDLLKREQGDTGGTPGQDDKSVLAVVLPVVPTSFTEGHELPPVDTNMGCAGDGLERATGDGASCKALGKEELGTDSHGATSADRKCPGEGSNLHSLAATWPSTMRVCQFRHPGLGEPHAGGGVPARNSRLPLARWPVK